MFKTCISSTSMTSEIANDLFSNIYGDNFNGDTSFLSTLRALLSPRIPKEDFVGLYFRRGYIYNPVTLDNITAASDIRYALQQITCTDFITPGMIMIANLPASEDNVKASFSFMEKHMPKVSGWHRLPKVTEFYRKAFGVMCYINPEIKSVVLVVENMDIRRMHYLQCSIFAFLPWYFDPEAGVDADEMELIQSLREKSNRKYINCIEKIAEKYDFRTTRIKKLLDGFENSYEKAQCAQLENDILSINRSINNYYESISDGMRQLREYNYRLVGLKSKLAEGDGQSEIMEYFLTNKKLSLLSVTGSAMQFCVKDYLMYFDEDMAKSVIDNHNSYIYTSLPGRIDGDDVEKLMYAIFIDQKLRIKFCATYNFDLGRLRVTGVANHDYRQQCEFSDCMPNPHIDRYSCLGNYEREINAALENRDYIFAIEQCVASCKSLNFGDSIVASYFVECLFKGNNANENDVCIELPDGDVVNATKAIEWLKSQENQEVETNE